MPDAFYAFSFYTTISFFTVLDSRSNLQRLNLNFAQMHACASSLCCQVCMKFSCKCSIFSEHLQRIRI